MSLLFLDSFDHINSGSLMTRKWNIVTGTVTMVTGRSGSGNAAQLTNCQIAMNLAALPSMAMGCAMKFQQSGTFLIAGDGTVGFTVNLVVTNAGVFQILLNVNNGSAETAPSAFSINFGQLWYYIELTSTITHFDATTVTISFDLHVNGVSVYSGSLTATGNITGHNPDFARAIYGNNGSWLFDDIYITDGELLGELDILALFRATDGSTTAWTPNIAGAHYLMVNQHSPDDNTTYLASSTPGQEDMGTMDQITVTGTCKGIQGVWDASMLGGDSASGEYKSGGTTVLAANPFPLGLYTLYSLDPRRKSPFTALDWTIAEINAMQNGIKKIT